MTKATVNNIIQDIDLNDDLFLKLLGQFLKRTREAAGFPTIRSFTDTIDMSYSQYQGYESGKNITIKTLKQILEELNIKTSYWLNINILNPTPLSLEDLQKLKEGRINQVIAQVEKIDSKKESLALRIIDAQRYIDILIHCHQPRTRSNILTKLTELEDTHNTFKRVAGDLLKYGWLAMTDPNSPNNPSQRYYTTEAGKKVLKLSDTD